MRPRSYNTKMNKRRASMREAHVESLIAKQRRKCAEGIEDGDLVVLAGLLDELQTLKRKQEKH